MRAERPRAARYPFVTDVTLTDLESGEHTIQKTRDISLFGCRLVPGNSLSTATRVRVQMTHKGEVFEAFGRVANTRADSGLGIFFTKVEDRHQLTLEKCIAELRSRRS